MAVVLRSRYFRYNKPSKNQNISADHEDDDNDDNNRNGKHTLTTTDSNLTVISNHCRLRRRLDEHFFTSQSTEQLAKSLLGQYLCRLVNNDNNDNNNNNNDCCPSSLLMRGIIVETEAYLGAQDHASYSFGGRRTVANEPMYMPAGTCFTRFTYGMYYCFNISSSESGGAVLVRAVEPVDGIELMRQHRRTHHKAPNNDCFERKPHQLANGPSKLCIAFAIDRTLNKASLLTDERIWLEPGPQYYDDECGDIVHRPRIGISAKNPWATKELRYYLRHFKSVSKK